MTHMSHVQICGSNRERAKQRESARERARVRAACRCLLIHYHGPLYACIQTKMCRCLSRICAERILDTCIQSSLHLYACIQYQIHACTSQYSLHLYACIQYMHTITAYVYLGYILSGDQILCMYRDLDCMHVQRCTYRDISISIDCMHVQRCMYRYISISLYIHP